MSLRIAEVGKTDKSIGQEVCSLNISPWSCLWLPHRVLILLLPPWEIKMIICISYSANGKLFCSLWCWDSAKFEGESFSNLQELFFYPVISHLKFHDHISKLDFDLSYQFPGSFTILVKKRGELFCWFSRFCKSPHQNSCYILPLDSSGHIVLTFNAHSYRG